MTESQRPDVPDLPTAVVREADSTMPRISLTSDALHEESRRFWHWLAERAPFARLLTQRVASNERDDGDDGDDGATTGVREAYEHHEGEPHVPDRDDPHRAG
jgi:hypothetical protein